MPAGITGTLAVMPRQKPVAGGRGALPACGDRARGVPWWGVLSSAAAPVLMIGGWTVAAALQPGNFDPVTETISALAAHGAAHRWVMTAALAGLGICHITTGLALRPAARPGRLLLMAGGVATIVVAANPLPAAGGGSLPHGLAAGAGFVALAIWPAAGWRRHQSVPGGLRPAACAAATVVLLGLLGWFAAELWTGGGQIGLSERVLAGAQSLWPLAVVLIARWPQSRTAARHHAEVT
jgi:hypothetical membrane protein